MIRNGSSPAGLRDDLDALLAMLRDRRRLLESGRLVDLDGLDTRIEAICRELSTLPAELGRDLIPPLAAVAEELAALDAECRQRLTEPDIDRAGARRAAEVYAKPKPGER